MKGIIFALAFLFAATAQADQGWQDNQDCSGFTVARLHAVSSITNLTDPTVVIESTAASHGESALHFRVNGVEEGGIRTDYDGAVNAFSEGGGYAICVNGDPPNGGTCNIYESNSNDVIIGPASGGTYIPTGATNGFLWTNTMRGSPTAGLTGFTSVPSAWPLVNDVTHLRSYLYDFDVPAWIPMAQYTGGHGTGCVQTDNAGIQTVVACGSGGSVTSVNGTAGQILCTPTSPNPVCSLVAAGTAGSCTNCSITFDSLGRETSQASGTAPVVSVTGTAQRVSVSPTTVNPVVDTIGGFYSGAVSGGNENLGTLTTGLDKITVTAGVAVMSTAVSGTDYQPPTALTCSAGQFVNEIDNTGTVVCGTPSGGGGGTVTSVTGANGVTCSPTSPNPTCTLANLTCGSNTFVSSASSGSGLVCTQPSFANLSGSAACSQLPALTGDLTTVAGTCGTTLASVVTAGSCTDCSVTYDAKGRVTAASSGTPVTPVAPLSLVGSNLGEAFTCGSNTFASSSTVAGGLVCTQPSFANLSGSATCAQLPALTGAVTSSAGSCATSVTATTCGGGTFVTAMSSSAALTCTVPTFGDLGGLLGCSQTPTFTGGNVVSTGSTCALNVVQSAVFTSTLPYAFVFLALLNTGELISGGSSPNPTGSIGTTQTEYPMGVAVGHLVLWCKLVHNFISSGTFVVKAARNGSDTTASLSFTSATTAGTYVSGPITVSSGATTDTWGLDVTSVGLSSSCGGGLCPSDAMCTVVLTP